MSNIPLTFFSKAMVVLRADKEGGSRIRGSTFGVEFWAAHPRMSRMKAFITHQVILILSQNGYGNIKKKSFFVM
jgi:hypothetical protein